MTCKKRMRALTAFVAVLLMVAASPAVATRDGGQLRPWKVSYTGVFEAPSHTCAGDFDPYFAVGEGTATHLGRVAIEVSSCVHPTTGAIADGIVVYRAANGDELHGTFVGQVLLPNPDGSVPILVIGTYDGGTGRFSQAAGAASAVELLDPAAGVIVGEITGTISYEASDRSQ